MDCYRSKRVSQMPLVSYNLLNSQITYQPITVIPPDYKDTSNVAKKAAEVAQKKEQ